MQVHTDRGDKLRSDVVPARGPVQAVPAPRAVRQESPRGVRPGDRGQDMDSGQHGGDPRF